MNADKHARIKTIFFDAIDLLPEQRQAFVDKACGDDDTIAHEVKSLLRNHHDGTVLVKLDSTSNRSSKDSSQVIAGHSRLEKSIAAPPEPKLVISELWNENRELLQKRLRIFAMILGLIVGYSFVVKALQPTPLFGLALRMLCLTINIACLRFLDAGDGPLCCNYVSWK